MGTYFKNGDTLKATPLNVKQEKLVKRKRLEKVAGTKHRQYS